MKMHEHDYEIIMALAEGTLDEAATAAAEAAISVCPECSADLELQRFALGAIAETPDVYLTATESARLHEALKAELVGATPPPVRAKSSFAWGRWLPAVGIAAVFLVAIVSLPGLFGGGFSGDSADETVAASETTAAAIERMEATEAPVMEAAPADDGANDTMAGGDIASAALDDSQEYATATTAAAAETTAAPAETTTTAGAPTTTTSEGGNVMDVLPYLGSLDNLDTDALLENLISDPSEQEELSALAKDIDPLFAECSVNNTLPANAAALGIPIDSEPILLGIVSTPIDEELVLVAYVPANVSETVFATQQAYFCQVVEVLP